MYIYKFVAICRTDKKNHIHFFTGIANSEKEARRPLVNKFVLYFRARLPFGGAL